MTDRVNLTAAELISELSKIPPDTVVTTWEHDSEWMRSYAWSIARVTDTGILVSGNLLDSHDDFEDDDD